MHIDLTAKKRIVELHPFDQQNLLPFYNRCFQTSFKYAPNELHKFCQAINGMICYVCLVSYDLVYVINIYPLYTVAQLKDVGGEVGSERMFCPGKQVLVFKGGQHVYFPFLEFGGGGWGGGVESLTQKANRLRVHPGQPLSVQCPTRGLYCLPSNRVCDKLLKFALAGDELPLSAAWQFM